MAGNLISCTTRSISLCRMWRICMRHLLCIICRCRRRCCCWSCCCCCCCVRQMKWKSKAASPHQSKLRLHTRAHRICFVAVCSVSLAPLEEEVLPTQLASLLASPCSSNFASHFPFSQKFFPFQLHSCFSFSSCCCSSFATHTHKEIFS